MLNVQTIRAAQNGDEDAIQLIFQTLRQLILYKTKNYFFQDGDREDVNPRSKDRSFKSYQSLQ